VERNTIKHDEDNDDYIFKGKKQRHVIVLKNTRWLCSPT